MVLKIGKLMLTTVGYAKIAAVAEACQTDSSSSQTPAPVSASTHNQAVVLQQALQHIPNPNAECVLRNVAIRLGRHAAEEVGHRSKVKIYQWLASQPVGDLPIILMWYAKSGKHMSLSLAFNVTWDSKIHYDNWFGKFCKLNHCKMHVNKCIANLKVWDINLFCL